MSVLDMILVDELIESPTTVNVNYVTIASDLTFKEDAFAIQVNYSNGSSVDMVLALEVSLDGENYSEIPASLQNITDPSGSHIWDLNDSGSHYMRVKVTVNTGSIDLDRVVIQMRRRH